MAFFPAGTDKNGYGSYGQSNSKLPRNGHVVFVPSLVFRIEEILRRENVRNDSRLIRRTLFVLQWVYPDVPISARAVDAVASMPDLEEVHFQVVHFENGALLGMQRMRKLKSLQFWGCKIDGDDLKGLAELKDLRILKIYWPLPNAKAGMGEFHEMPPEEHKRTLESLCKLTQLKELVLEESFRQDEGTLKRHLPETKIAFESIGYDIP